MRFVKVHGLGNDFIVVDANQLAHRDYSQLAQNVCRRCFSLGADGLIVFRQTDSAVGGFVRMQIFNADGSEAELSGNGLRCLAALLIHRGYNSVGTISVETLVGTKTLTLMGASPPEYQFKLDMGEPIFDRAGIDFCSGENNSSLVGYRLRVDENVYAVTITSMGNPHCSLFVKEFQEFDWAELGPRFETHPSFPRRTNVEFVRIKSRKSLEVRFWERGVGQTNASGTGACAAVVAAVLNGFVDRDVRVQTLGGILEVSWHKNNQMSIIGPARLICEGEYYSMPSLECQDGDSLVGIDTEGKEADGG